MCEFDQKYNGENNYVKSNPDFLKAMFGRTDLDPFWLADMDFKVAEPITKEIKRLAERANFSYEFKTEAVFKAIVEWNKRRNNFDLKTDAFIQVPGVLTGIALLIREFTHEGDGIIVQTPVYHQFFELIKTAKREIVENPLRIIDGKYAMDFEDLKLKIASQKAKAIILCNPHNPVGRVWSKRELEELVEIANAHGVVIISDEIHSDIIYQPHQFTSIASLKNAERHITILGSPAKAFGMHSIANGYLYLPNKQKYNQVKSTVASMYLDHGNVISGYATLAAYNHSEEWLNAAVEYMGNTIEWVAQFVEKQLPVIRFFKPEGTYQLWFDFSDLGLSSEELSRLLMDEAKLALTPGIWFGEGHDLFIRVNIASPLADIKDAFFRIKNVIEKADT